MHQILSAKALLLALYCAIAILLDHGVNVNWTNCDGETAFSYTCARNQFAAAKLLHLHGANINSVDSSGGTPLDWAVCHGHPDFRAWLRRIGGIRNFDWDEWLGRHQMRQRHIPSNDNAYKNSGFCVVVLGTRVGFKAKS